MLLSAFNELKAKEYLKFQCICGQDRKTHWIQQPKNIFRMVEFQLEDVFLVIFHLQHRQKAQRGGVLHLGPINGKNGALRGGKTKNVGISDNNDNAKVTHRLSTRRPVQGTSERKGLNWLPSSLESGLHL